MGGKVSQMTQGGEEREMACEERVPPPRSDGNEEAMIPESFSLVVFVSFSIKNSEHISSTWFVFFLS